MNPSHADVPDVPDVQLIDPAWVYWPPADVKAVCADKERWEEAWNRISACPRDPLIRVVARTPDEVSKAYYHGLRGCVYGRAALALGHKIIPAIIESQWCTRWDELGARVVTCNELAARPAGGGDLLLTVCLVCKQQPAG